MAFIRFSLVVLVFLTIRPGCTESPPYRESFPLTKGSYWIYEGEKQWQEHGPKLFKETLKQRMEVVDRIERGSIVAAVIRGYPTGEQDSRQVMIVVDGLQYYLLPADKPADKEVLSRLNDSNDELVDLVKEDQIELSLPLVKGKRFCEAEQMTRPDGFYCNVVEQRRTKKFVAVSGVSDDVRYSVYTITFRTLPDHVILNFAAGIGITSYEYEHHGTIQHEYLKLVELHNAKAPAP